MMTTRLDNVLLSLESGARPKGGATSDGGDIPSLGGEHLNDRGSFNLANVKLISRSFFDEMRAGRIQPGDILVVKDGATTGKTSMVRADFPYREAAVNEHVFCLRVDPSMASSEYIFHFLYSPMGQKEIRRDYRGSTVGGISRAFPEKVSLPLPPLDEQRRIADILDKLDTLCTQRRAAIAQLDTLSWSIFLEMFGDPRSNPYGWAVHKIGDVVKDFRGGASLAPDDFVTAGFPVLHKGAIKKNGKIAIDPKKKTFARDTYAAANRRSQVDRSFAAVTLRDLVAAGPTIGLVADLSQGPSDRYLLAQGVYGFRVDEHVVVREYLVALSNIPTFRHVLRQNAVGSTQIHIRTPVYLNIEIPTPPLATQIEFARRVARLRQVERAQSASRNQLDALFASVQNCAFNGAL